MIEHQSSVVAAGYTPRTVITELWFQIYMMNGRMPIFCSSVVPYAEQQAESGLFGCVWGDKYMMCSL
jgi:hypothetical protein